MYIEAYIHINVTEETSFNNCWNNQFVLQYLCSFSLRHRVMAQKVVVRSKKSSSNRPSCYLSIVHG